MPNTPQKERGMGKNQQQGASPIKTQKSNIHPKNSHKRRRKKQPGSTPQSQSYNISKSHSNLNGPIISSRPTYTFPTTQHPFATRHLTKTSPPINILTKPHLSSIKPSAQNAPNTTRPGKHSLPTTTHFTQPTATLDGLIAPQLVGLTKFCEHCGENADTTTYDKPNNPLVGTPEGATFPTNGKIPLTQSTTLE